MNSTRISSVYGNGGASLLASSIVAAARRLGRARRFALSLTVCFVSITLSVPLVAACGSNSDSENVIWIANGMLLAYLLLAPRWRWPAYLVSGMAGLILGSVLTHDTWRDNLIFNSLDMVEVLTAALLLRARSTQLPNFTRGAYVFRFLICGALCGPGLSAALFSFLQASSSHHSPVSLFFNWMAADGLGIAVICPIFVAIFQSRRLSTPHLRRHWAYLVLLVLVTFGVFGQAKVPLLFLIYPLLVLVLLRLGLGWAALSSLFIAFVGGWSTFHGKGPFAQAAGVSLSVRCLLMQGFVASGMFVLYSVSVVLESRRAIERRLERIATLHELVTENSLDAIIVADLHGNRSYVSAAVERLTGWPPDKFTQMKTLDLVHPDDLPRTAAIVSKLTAGSEGETIECRILKFHGGYIWVEASLRLLRNPKTGAPSGILNIVRDITERKLAEAKLQDAYHAVEALAATDALTGLANRRRFDQQLLSEWRRGVRDKTPLSVLMIDADLFKLYNDAYGHTRGDGCLKQIAEAAQDVINRPGDLVARFGGEEFAVVLPNTDNDGAMLLANEICQAMRQRRLSHAGNPFGIVTVSVGCATTIPAFGRNRSDLIESADEALYEAKHCGRNQVRNALAENVGLLGSRHSA